MAESIAQRVGRLVAGGFNAIVDAVENAAPEAVMEQAIREIDGAVDDVRTELGRVIANKHLATNRLMQENQRHDDLAEKIRVAVNEDREDLAEAAISQQMDIEAQIPVLEAAISDASQKERELESYISALKGKKREMEGELIAYRKSRETTPSMDSTAKSDGSSTQDNVDGATATFDRVLGRAGSLPGSSTDTERQNASRLAELDELARKNRIRERLEQVKAESQE